jgi:hypothetical protein
MARRRNKGRMLDEAKTVTVEPARMAKRAPGRGVRRSARRSSRRA